MKVMKEDPTSIPTLNSLILNDPFVDEETQRTAELFHISLYLSTDLLNPALTLTRFSQFQLFSAQIQHSTEQNEVSAVDTPTPTSHRRKLRLVRNEHRFLHKASVDDYDFSPQEEEPQPVVYPLLTYDPGLLDMAVIVVHLNRTQRIVVCPT